MSDLIQSVRRRRRPLRLGAAAMATLLLAAPAYGAWQYGPSGWEYVAQDRPAPEAEVGKDQVRFYKGLRDFNRGRYFWAGYHFRKLIKRDKQSPWRPEAMWLRAEALFHRRHYHEAFLQYEEMLNQYAGSPHYQEALRREWEIAEIFLGPGRRRVLGLPLLPGNTEALQILRRIYEHQPTGELADDVILRIADYHWSKGNWPAAQDYYDKYCREYPNGPGIQHAELRRAKCPIENCRGPRYDTSGLKLALDRLRQYQRKYPELAAEEGVADLVRQVRLLQAESMYRMAAFYRRAGYPLAAAFYCDLIEQRFADTPWSPRARELVERIKTPLAEEL